MPVSRKVAVFVPTSPLTVTFSSEPALTVRDAGTILVPSPCPQPAFGHAKATLSVSNASKVNRIVFALNILC